MGPSSGATDVHADAFAGESAHPPAGPTVAILPWGLLIDDFLESNGLRLESFFREASGGWLFGYAEALRRAGVRSVILCVSRRVDDVTRLVNRPTGAIVTALPASRFVRRLRRRMRHPHGVTVEQAFGELRGVAQLSRPLLELARQAAPYVVTPPRLLVQELRRERCRAILCQEYEFPRFDVCAAVSKLTRIPLFGTFQGGDYQHWPLERLTRGPALRASRGLIIVPRAEAERAGRRYGIRQEKIRSIFNPVDVVLWRPEPGSSGRAALGIPSGARVAVWHGRVEMRKKGLDVLLDAWGQLCGGREAAAFRLVLIGTGRDVSDVRTRIEELDLGNVIFVDEYLHDKEAMRSYLNAGDVYAFPSRHEGLAVAPMEAMACGLPVVAADASGIAEMLPAGEASGGIVVPREDSSALAQALGRVLDDASLGRELGDRGRRRAVDQFSLEVVGRQLRTFLLSEELDR